MNFNTNIIFLYIIFYVLLFFLIFYSKLLELLNNLFIKILLDK